VTSLFSDFSPDLIIYHDHCADGAAAVWAALQAHPPVKTIAVRYNEAPPDVTGLHVVIVDFSFLAVETLAMCATAKSVTILDHHKTAAENLDGVAHPNLDVRIDQEKSGARLSWEFFHPEVEVPMVIRYVEDRDLWRWALDGSAAISALIDSYGLSIETIEKISSMPEDSAIAEGEAVLRYKKLMIEEVAQSATRIVFDGIPAFAVFCPPSLKSEVGNAMAVREPDVKLAVLFTLGGAHCSLRSSADGPDVSVLARKYDGGGHLHAASFRISGTPFENLKPSVLFGRG
jgi:uncharacterized protein